MGEQNMVIWRTDPAADGAELRQSTPINGSRLRQSLVQSLSRRDWYGGGWRGQWGDQTSHFMLG